VRIDDVAGGRTAVQHLVNLGHERIALISGTPGDPMGFTSQFDRRRGYRETLRSAGLEVDPSLDVPGDFTVEGGEMAMARLLSLPRPPTAVFAESDEMAFGALRTLQRAGLSAPRDMSLIGFDDHLLADLMNLTTIAQPVREQGARAAEMLLEVLGGHSGEHRVTLPTRLIVRGTTGPERRARAA
jgi:DNA-binding LacI/PurR family transcriptional regulator